ncbi:MAG: biotin--[acetyl-CoA-carboxylase] ligase [Eubacteriales bacterium]|nr:biotin--[acetyl-CoA-carboxylase] ligase [Eubacteriales bacterium]
MKNTILDALADNYFSSGVGHAGFVSGADLSVALGVTRAAISKTVGQLVAAGYPIESQKHYGYRLTHLPEQLSAPIIRYALIAAGSLQFADSVTCLVTVDSTNLAARRGAEQGAADFSLFVAEEQSAGRGRRGRNWRSASGEGLWFSLLLRPTLLPEKLATITLFAGYCVAEALREQTGLDIQLKWPNDLVVMPSGRKLGGILTETILEENLVSAVIIGIGINVKTTEFPADLQAIATSLAIEKVDSVSPRVLLLSGMLANLENRWPAFVTGQSDWLEAYRKICATLNRPVVIADALGREITGQAISIAPEGDLIVERTDGTNQAITAGEVSVRGLLGYV